MSSKEVFVLIDDVYLTKALFEGDVDQVNINLNGTTFPTDSNIEVLMSYHPYSSYIVESINNGGTTTPPICDQLPHDQCYQIIYQREFPKIDFNQES